MKKIGILLPLFFLTLLLLSNVEVNAATAPGKITRITKAHPLKTAIKGAIKPQKQVKTKVPMICQNTTYFYGNCGGIQVTCGWFTLAWWCDSMVIYDIDTFSACADPHLCDGVFGWA